MNHQAVRQPRQYLASTHRAIVNADAAIEWEELPSLVATLQQRGANDSRFGSASGTVWDATMPATFDPAPVSQPFHEALPGLSAREVFEDGVFQHFFTKTR